PAANSNQNNNNQKPLSNVTKSATNSSSKVKSKVTSSKPSTVKEKVTSSKPAADTEKSKVTSSKPTIDKEKPKVTALKTSTDKENYPNKNDSRQSKRKTFTVRSKKGGRFSPYKRTTKNVIFKQPRKPIPENSSLARRQLYSQKLKLWRVSMIKRWFPKFFEKDIKASCKSRKEFKEIYHFSHACTVLDPA
ncbi:8375_t:CDS:2, partial [Ambispora leptoticha]